jgi:hypothetical protein
MKSTCKTLAQGCPAKVFAVLRIATGPSNAFLTDLLGVVKGDWMWEQGGRFCSGEQYRYSILESLRLQENYMFTMLSMLTTDVALALLLVSWRSEALISLLFRSIAAGAGGCHELLYATSRYPHILFMLIVILDPVELQNLVDDIQDAFTNYPCVMDPFSLTFVEQFFDRLSTPLVLSLLEAIVLALPISIHNIECRNGKLRRLSESQDGTWALCLAQLAARFDLSTFRVVNQGPYDAAPSASVARTPWNKKQWKWVIKAKEKGKQNWRLQKRLNLGLKRLTNGGGSYRAFLSERLAGIKWSPLILRRAAHHYHLLTLTEKACVSQHCVV